MSIKKEQTSLFVCDVQQIFCETILLIELTLNIINDLYL